MTSIGYVGGAQDLAASSLSAGAQFGYNWQLTPDWVLGVEGDIGRLGNAHTAFDLAHDTLTGVKADWFSTLRGRIGYSPGPAMIYITGGAALANVRNTDTDAVTSVPPLTGSETHVMGGVEPRRRCRGGVVAKLERENRVSLHGCRQPEYLHSRRSIALARGRPLSRLPLRRELPLLIKRKSDQTQV
jgi:opacity protein-like surface antigen